LPPEEFIDKNGQETVRCLDCRTNDAIYDKQTRLSGIKHSYPLSASTKEKKKEWRAINYDKIASYIFKYKGKRIRELGEKYWEMRRESAKIRRKMMTDEDRLKMNDKKRKNKKDKLGFYKYRAMVHKIEWNITDDDAIDMFGDDCYYCKNEAGEYRQKYSFN
jgi:hypothetical protein